jgi:cytochrome c-type biogenesis protein CcmE
MTLLPKSRKARRRLAAVAIAAPILVISAALVYVALGGDKAVSFFYSPSAAKEARVPAGRTIELGGLVEAGTLRKTDDGGIAFNVTDLRGQDPVVYRGEVPDLFREGQGVVAKGAFRADGVFLASEILAKHDERYMPRELVSALKASGEWRGQGNVAGSTP